jgi:hypothetical protein
MTIMFPFFSLFCIVAIVAVAAAVGRPRRVPSTRDHAEFPHSASEVHRGQSSTALRLLALSVLVGVGLLLFAGVYRHPMASETQVFEAESPGLNTTETRMLTVAPAARLPLTDSELVDAKLAEPQQVEESTDGAAADEVQAAESAVKAEVGQNGVEPPVDPQSSTEAGTVAEVDTESELDETDAPSVPAGDQQYFILPVSAETLQALVGPEYADSLQTLSESLPANLPQAYALIPMPKPVPDGIPEGIQQLLTPDRISTLVTAFSKVWNGSERGMQPADTAAMLAEQIHQEEQPAWVQNPGLGRVVVESQFVDASVTTEEALRPAVTTAFNKHVLQIASKKFAEDAGTLGQVQLSLGDTAFKKCLVSSYTRTEILPTRLGPAPMRQVFALVEVPAELERHALQKIEKSIQLNRTVTLCVAAAAIWLAVLLLMVLLRIQRSASRFKRWIAVPLCGLMIVPCLMVFAGTVAAMVQNDVPAVYGVPDEIAIDAGSTSGQTTLVSGGLTL